MDSAPDPSCSSNRRPYLRRSGAPAVCCQRVLSTAAVRGSGAVPRVRVYIARPVVGCPYTSRLAGRHRPGLSLGSTLGGYSSPSELKAARQPTGGAAGAGAAPCGGVPRAPRTADPPPSGTSGSLLLRLAWGPGRAPPRGEEADIAPSSSDSLTARGCSGLAQRAGQAAMRRCSSDPNFETYQPAESGQRPSQSFAACPSTSAKARWKWAFQMTKKFCKVSHAHCP